MGAFFDTLLLGKQYNGIEFFSVNNEEKIAFLQVEKKKDRLDISKNVILANRDELVLEKNNCATVVVINNSNVLQKKVQSTDSNDKKVLHKAFPNLQLEEFYYEIWRIGSGAVVSICRKYYVDSLITSLKKDFKITTVSLGLSSIDSLTSFSIPRTLTTNTHTINLDNDNIIQPGNVASLLMDINGLSITNDYVLSFAGVVQLLTNRTTSGSIQQVNDQLVEDFKQRSFFDKTIKMAIALMLIILLMNFGFFSYYFDKAKVADEAVALNKAGIENIVKLKEKIKNKELALNGVMNNTVAKSSPLLNTIGKAVPSTISLSELCFNPLEKKPKEGESIVFQEKLLTIAGTTMSNEDFSDWVADLEHLSDIKNVTIANFGKNQEGETSFIIKAAIK